MCGIVGYIGDREISNVIIDGLYRLEYRGYDSAGIAVLGKDGKFHFLKDVGRVSDLAAKVDFEVEGGVGIGHSRWATHGAPSVTNAHPHMDCNERFFLVHNGIIENYRTLKEELIKKGHRFLSETDTEVMVHLVEDYVNEGLDVKEAFLKTLKQIEGAYAIVLMDRLSPDTLYVARKGSPIVLGIKDNEKFVASDIPAILPYSKKVIFLEDFDMAILKKNSFKIYSILSQEEVERKIVEINWDIQMAEKGGFPHFMLKEIFEQPMAILATIRDRIKNEIIFIDELEELWLKGCTLPKRLILVACGTSYHAALIAKYFIESVVEIPVVVDVASEFRYRKQLVSKDDWAVYISQSGETADTLSALRSIKSKVGLNIGIVNVLGSTLSRESDIALYTFAGPEIGVASTKAFTSQLALLYLMGLWLAWKKGVDEEKLKLMQLNLALLPSVIDSVLELNEKIRFLAEKYAKYKHFFYLARGINWPVAQEGALKLKEISYIHAESYPAGEMKHGPIALLDENFPCFFIATDSKVYEKVLSNIKEAQSRKAPIIALASDGNKEILDFVHDCIFVPKVPDILSPIVNVIPLQLFAYWVANILGRDIDKPRNLAKSVTVE